MSRTLIIYYSNTGTTGQAAQQLQALTGWPIAEVRDEQPRKGLLGRLRILFDSLLALPAHFRYEGPELNGFDRVVVSSPIWLGLLASPMRGFLSEQFREPGPVIPHVSLVCLTSGRSAWRAAAEVATYAGHAPEPVAALPCKDVRNGTSSAALQELARSVQALDTWPAVRRPLWLWPKAA